MSLRTILWLSPVLALIAGCSVAGKPASDRIPVLAAFYPLQYAAQQVGGSAVSVESLTPPGVEPHDVELSPVQVAEISEADLIVYIKGFQPAVDDALAQYAPDRALDVSEGITLLPSASGAQDGALEGGSTTDPHLWLNPLNMIKVGRTIEARLAAIDQSQSDAFSDRAATLDDRLRRLDRLWTRGTETCASRDLVVSHAAFGYLAAQYRFEQVGITGLVPDAEPSPSDVAAVADFVRANDVHTIYFETLVDPKVAQTVATETGATTAVLDPLEGLPPGSTQDYLSVMEQNLRTVERGQPCS